jgi:hypothetical protein
MSVGIPLEKHQGVREGREKGKELRGQKQQDLVGKQVQFYALHIPALAPSCIPGEPCAGGGTLILCLTGSSRPQWPWTSFPGQAPSIYLCSC